MSSGILVISQRSEAIGTLPIGEALLELARTPSRDHTPLPPGSCSPTCAGYLARPPKFDVLKSPK